MFRASAILLSAVFAFSSVPAQAAPTDGSESVERILSLKDGAIYRGELIEYVPRSHIVLRLPSGEVRRFDASQIKHVKLVASATSAVPMARPVEPKARPAPAAPPLPLPPAVVEELPPPPPAEAAPPDQPNYPPPPVARNYDARAYQEHVHRGDDAFDNHHYRSALEHYQLALQMSGEPKAHALIAKAHRKLGNFAEAYNEYREYLATDGTLDPTQRQHFEERMADMAQRQQAFATLPPQEQAADLAYVTMRSPVPGTKLQLLVEHQELDNAYWFSAYQKWRTACEGECNEPVYRKATMRVVFPQESSAPQFELPRQDRDVLVRVRPYSTSTRSGAYAMMGVGIGLNLIGIGLMAVGTNTDEMLAGPRETPLMTYIGLGMFLGGAAIAIGSTGVFRAARAAVTVE